MFKKILKQKLHRWPRIFLFLIILNQSCVRFWRRCWQWRWLIPYRFRKYPNADLYAFHGDKILRDLVTELIQELRPTALVETGTFKASTALFLARLAANRTPLYTCEMSGLHFRESRWRLRDMPGVTLVHSPSPAFINHLVEQKVLGKRPFFFLDAHSGGSMPLMGELRALAPLSHAIIIIDDFLVPGQDQFHYDQYNYEVGKVRPIDLSLIASSLNSHHTYQIFFPHYTADEAFGATTMHDDLRGHALILVNLQNECQRWQKRGQVLPLHYKEHLIHVTHSLRGK